MSKKSGGGVSLNQVSFWLLVSSAVLYVLGLIFNYVGLASIVIYLQSVAAALMICVVSVLAWRYVDSKQVVWKVLYFLVLLIVLVAIIIPLAIPGK